MIKLGDAIAYVTGAFGVAQCPACKKRQAILNAAQDRVVSGATRLIPRPIRQMAQMTGFGGGGGHGGGGHHGHGGGGHGSHGSHGGFRGGWGPAVIYSEPDVHIHEEPVYVPVPVEIDSAKSLMAAYPNAGIQSAVIENGRIMVHSATPDSTRRALPPSFDRYQVHVVR